MNAIKASTVIARAIIITGQHNKPFAELDRSVILYATNSKVRNWHHKIKRQSTKEQAFYIGWIDAKDMAEDKAHEWSGGLPECNIDGYDLDITELAICIWCDDEVYKDDLVVSADGSTMVCEHCEKRTTTFFGRIGLRGREKLQSKYAGKGVSNFEIGDILQVRQYPFDGFTEWIQTRIYDIGGGLFLLEKF